MGTLCHHSLHEAEISGRGISHCSALTEGAYWHAGCLIIVDCDSKTSHEANIPLLMSQPIREVYLARHGETAWTVSGQHTGRKDLPLTANGERNALQLGQRLQGLTFNAVFTSPLQRARRTCELAGFSAVAQVEPNLTEWDYGAYEGKRLEEILADHPDWNLFRDGCPSGETPSQVGARADRVLARIRDLQGNVLLFSSGHFLRILADRWMQFAPGTIAPYLLLSTASLSILSYEEQPSQHAIRLWNDDHHVRASKISARETSAQSRQPARCEERG
jgi:broad specificity phosphatase PhoE